MSFGCHIRMWFRRSENECIGEGNTLENVMSFFSFVS